MHLKCDNTPPKQLKNDSMQQQEKSQLLQRQITSNRVLVIDEDPKFTYLLPAYIRIAFKKITGLDFQHNVGQMSATLLLTIHYKGLSDDYKRRVREGINIGINNQIFCSLDPAQKNADTASIEASQDLEKGEYTLTWRSIFPLKMNCDVFWMPFELINLSINFAIRTITWRNPDGKRIVIKTNFMNTKDEVEKLSLQQNEDFGQYGLADKKFSANYNYELPIISKQEPQEQNKKGKQNQQVKGEEIKYETKTKHRNWQYAQFRLAVYRHPMPTIITIFFPFLLLAIINLCVFFQDYKLSERISSIATIMVAYTTFLPTIRQSIPKSPNAIMLDYILYGLISTSLLCLFGSWMDRSKIRRYRWQKDQLFILSFILVCQSVFVVLFAIYKHKYQWEKEYRSSDEELSQKRYPKDKKFDSSKWNCPKADQYFKTFKKKIKQLQPNEQNHNPKQRLLASEATIVSDTPQKPNLRMEKTKHSDR